MSKIKMTWTHTGWISVQTEVPQSKKVWDRQENKRINRQIKQINRKQHNIMFTQYGRTR